MTLALALLAACTPVENEPCDPAFTDLAGDGLDQDCDGLDGVDRDGDGEASVASGGADCDDAAADVHPGAEDVCDGRDEDCSGVPDDGPGSATFYRDADGDGLGNAGDRLVACAAPDGWAAEPGDCDDARAVVGLPGAWHADADLDGFGDPSQVLAEGCVGPAGSVADATDCDDARPDVGGASPWYPDADGDGFGDAASLRLACAAEPGELPVGGDCDDADAAAFPGAVETCAAGDEDCDGATDDADPSAVRPVWFADQDGDGYGDPAARTSACVAPAGHVADGADCDDARAEVHPGAVEVPSDGVDQDCDAADPPDADRDGFAVPENCDDGDPNLSPTNTDLVGDHIDQNCDGTDGLDEDRDGFAGTLTGGTDCVDSVPTVWPGAVELLGDLYDNGCDGGQNGFASLEDGDAVLETSDAFGEGAAGDFDADGDLDVLVGLNVFEDTPEGVTAPSGAIEHSGFIQSIGSVPDLDGDGAPEAVVFTGSRSSLWMDGLSGRRSLEVDGAVHVADLDQDGLGDLIQADGRAGWVNAGPIAAGSFSPSAAPLASFDFGAGVNVTAIATGDANGDGIPDLAFLAFDAVYLAHGPVSGAYARADLDLMVSWDRENFTAVGLADLDGDGMDELLIAVGQTLLPFRADAPARLQVGDALLEREFNDTADSLRPTVDLTGDGLADLWACNYAACTLFDAAAILGGGPFLAGTVGSSVSVVDDVTGDGLPELFWMFYDTGLVRYRPWY